MPILTCVFQCKNGKKQIHPHQIECVSTLETAMAAFLADAYVEKLTKGKKKEPREVSIHLGSFEYPQHMFWL